MRIHDPIHTATFAAPLEQEHFQHIEGVDIADRHAAQVDANAAHLRREGATGENRPCRNARVERTADVRSSGARVRFHRQLRLQNHLDSGRWSAGRSWPPVTSPRAVGHAVVTGGDSGSSAQILVPRPTVLSARTRPPCPSTRCFTIASPRPVPPSERERPASTR